MNDMTLTDRQRRELAYHDSKHAAEYREIAARVDYALVKSAKRLWWNQIWQMYDEVLAANLAGKRVLVVGCGFGTDCCLLAAAGAEVYGFDLSPDSIRLARECAERDGHKIDLRVMPAERLDYPPAFFDAVLARDILHHVDIRATMAEVARVCKPGAIAIVNEVYTHSLADRIRNSHIVREFLYKRLVGVVYGDRKPYITEDERKMSERDIALVEERVAASRTRYFDMAINRVLPSTIKLLNVLDYLALNLARPLARFLGGRILITGRLQP
jgi:2-polyprenyl-3-methyl-5-hydroxy-6-metoxy-1,4-benzoquinol methylase